MADDEERFSDHPAWIGVSRPPANLPVGSQVRYRQRFFVLKQHDVELHDWGFGQFCVWAGNCIACGAAYEHRYQGRPSGFLMRNNKDGITCRVYQRCEHCRQQPYKARYAVAGYEPAAQRAMDAGTRVFRVDRLGFGVIDFDAVVPPHRKPRKSRKTGPVGPYKTLTKDAIRVLQAAMLLGAPFSAAQVCLCNGMPKQRASEGIKRLLGQKLLRLHGVDPNRKVEKFYVFAASLPILRAAIAFAEQENTGLTNP